MSTESSMRWVLSFLLSMIVAANLVIPMPSIAPWLPEALGSYVAP